MAEWTPEATDYLEGYLKQVRALAQSSGEDAEEIVSGLRDHITTKAEQESGALITLSALRQTLAAVGSPESIVEDSTNLRTRDTATAQTAPPPVIERVVVREPASKSGNVLRWVIVAAILVFLIPVVLAILSIIAAIAIPAWSRADESEQRAACAGNLKQIGLAIQHYKTDHNGTSPTAMSDLYPKYHDVADTFVCPGAANPPNRTGSIDEWSTYEFFTGADENAIVRDRSIHNHLPTGRNVLSEDGRVSFLREIGEIQTSRP